MLVKHCKLIQEEGCILFYRYNRALNGYMVAGLIIAPTNKGSASFLKIWKYFIKEIVKEDNIYCSLIVSKQHSAFDKYVTFYKNINGIDIYKIDNFLKKPIRDYAKKDIES